MNRVDRIVLDPNRTYPCTRTGVRVTISKNRAIEIAIMKKNFSAAASTAKQIAEPRGRQNNLLDG